MALARWSSAFFVSAAAALRLPRRRLGRRLACALSRSMTGVRTRSADLFVRFAPVAQLRVREGPVTLQGGPVFDGRYFRPRVQRISAVVVLGDRYAGKKQRRRSYYKYSHDSLDIDGAHSGCTGTGRAQACPAARTALSQTSKRERRSVEAVQLDAERRELREKILDVSGHCRYGQAGWPCDGRGCAARGARTAVGTVAPVLLVCSLFARMRMSGVVVAFPVMRMAVLARDILVVSEGHALPRHHRCHALHRNRNRQQGDSKKSEVRLTHPRPLYPSRFEPEAPSRFQVPAPFLRCRPMMRCHRRAPDQVPLACAPGPCAPKSAMKATSTSKTARPTARTFAHRGASSAIATKGVNPAGL
jgi:hypothetical protein